MKKLFLAAAVASMSFLSACTPDVTQIQQITVQVCGFVPTAVQVASLFPNPYTTPAAVIAQAICDAVTAQTPLATRHRMARLKSGTSVTVNVGGQTLVVSGYFVR